MLPLYKQVYLYIDAICSCLFYELEGWVCMLQSRAGEREIIVNPIHCPVHPFDRKTLFFFLPFRNSHILSPAAEWGTHRSPGVHLKSVLQTRIIKATFHSVSRLSRVVDYTKI
jgi:hypothetical protein